MANPYYEERFEGAEHQLAVAEHVESELRRIQNAFGRLPIPGALASGGLLFVVTEGLVNAYTGQIEQITELTEGVNFLVRFHEINTGPSTLALNDFGALRILTLFGQEAEAGDLRAIRRLTYFGGSWVMQSIAPSDLEDAAAAVVAGLTQGPPGIPGASTVFAYNLLRTGAPVTGPGQYRFLMEPGSTAGVASDAGLRLATAFELAELDSGGEDRSTFYDEVDPGDIVTFFISARRWYAYTIMAAEAASSGNNRLWSIMPLAHENTAGDENLPTAETAYAFRWSRARAAIGGIPGVSGDQVLPDVIVTFHSAPADYTTNPLLWPPEPNGFLFRNNAGPTKLLVATISENGEVLSQVDHDGYLYQWLKDGAMFTPSVVDPILVPAQEQITTRRFLAINAEDVRDNGQNVFSCQVCLA